jgi:GNAT superfamily N-acetyltransferase
VARGDGTWGRLVSGRRVRRLSDTPRPVRSDCNGGRISAAPVPRGKGGTRRGWRQDNLVAAFATRYDAVMNDFVIRRATRADQPALGRYGAALMRQHYDFDPQRFILVDQPEKGYGRFLVSQLEERDSVVLVAERDGEVLGYTFASLEPASWKELRAACGFLHDVYVDERARRSGMGRRLVGAAIEWLESKQAPRVVLGSAAKNEGAQRFFAGLGFRPTMVEMTRELGASTG